MKNVNMSLIILGFLGSLAALGNGVLANQTQELETARAGARAAEYLLQYLTAEEEISACGNNFDCMWNAIEKYSIKRRKNEKEMESKGWPKGEEQIWFEKDIEYCRSATAIHYYADKTYICEGDAVRRYRHALGIGNDQL